MGCIPLGGEGDQCCGRWIVDPGWMPWHWRRTDWSCFGPVRTSSRIADPILNPDWERQITPAWLLWKSYFTEKYMQAEPLPPKPPRS